MENQGNRVFPSSYEVQFWENKTFMHRIFAERGIRTLATQVIPMTQVTSDEFTAYPFLVKEEHSCSFQGLYLIRNRADSENLISSLRFVQKIGI